MHAVRPVSNAAHVVRAVRTMLTRTRVTCGALPARGARRRVAPAFHETDTMKPLVLAIALALTLPVAASAQAPAPQAATAAPRSEARRVGKECVGTGRSRWSPNLLKKNIPKQARAHKAQQYTNQI